MPAIMNPDPKRNNRPGSEAWETFPPALRATGSAGWTALLPAALTPDANPDATKVLKTMRADVVTCVSFFNVRAQRFFCEFPC